MRWDRTHLVRHRKPFVVEHGFLSRRSASVSLDGTVFEVERTLLGRILGYGTVVAGELEIDYVPASSWHASRFSAAIGRAERLFGR